MRGLPMATLLVIAAVGTAEITYLTYSQVRAKQELCSFFDPSTSSSQEPEVTVDPAMKMLKARFR